MLIQFLTERVGKKVERIQQSNTVTYLKLATQKFSKNRRKSSNNSGNFIHYHTPEQICNERPRFSIFSDGFNFCTPLRVNFPEFYIVLRFKTTVFPMAFRNTNKTRTWHTI